VEVAEGQTETLGSVPNPSDHVKLVPPLAVSETQVVEQIVTEDGFIIAPGAKT
jgi:hypothetical protein